MPTIKEADCYILDTYRSSDSGKFHPGAITFASRRRMDTLRWPEQAFDTQEDANDFVRRQLARSPMREISNEGELRT